MDPDRERWNRKYQAGIHHPICVNLIMHLGRLTKGLALDVAGGIGENAAVLAMAGFRVVTADLSDEGVAAAKRRSRDLRADYHVVHADATRLPFRSAAFDTVLCTYFVDRTVDFVRFLKPGGTLFFESFTVGTLKYTPDFRRSFCLEEGELRRWFAGLEEILYKEQDDGRSVIATFIGRKR